jgi:hypothetical protein
MSCSFEYIVWSSQQMFPGLEPIHSALSSVDGCWLQHRLLEIQHLVINKAQLACTEYEERQELLKMAHNTCVREVRYIQTTMLVCKIHVLVV